MNIPSEVLAAAETAYYSRVTHSEYDSYLVIAEWARKEALRELRATIAELLRDPGIYRSAAVLGVHAALQKLDGATS